MLQENVTDSFLILLGRAPNRQLTVFEQMIHYFSFQGHFRSFETSALGIEFHQNNYSSQENRKYFLFSFYPTIETIEIFIWCRNGSLRIGSTHLRPNLNIIQETFNLRLGLFLKNSMSFLPSLLC